MPGFYFDEVTKKYFRILPSVNNVMSNVVTKEIIESKKLEDKRQNDLRLMNEDDNNLDKKTRMKVKSSIMNVVSVLDKVRLGQFNHGVGEAYIRKAIASSLRPQKSWSLSSLFRGYNSFVCGDICIYKMIMNDRQDSLALAWRNEGPSRSNRNTVGTINLKNFVTTWKKHTDSAWQDLITKNNEILHDSLCRISGIDWAKKNDSDALLFGITSDSLVDFRDTVLTLRNKTTGIVSNPRITRTDSMNIGETALQCCAWNNVTNSSFAVALEDECAVFDVNKNGHLHRKKFIKRSQMKPTGRPMSLAYVPMVRKLI